MDVILKEDIKGLGYKNDTVSVKPGYGRNYLIPQGLAIISNRSNAKMIEENIRQAAHKAEKIKNDAEATAAKIQSLTIEISTKAGESGKIFGAITALQVADALREKGIDVDRKKVEFKAPIKSIGEHQATIMLHKEVQPELALNIVAE